MKTNIFQLLDLVTPGANVTTSLKVAEVFGKRHDNVIRAIRNLVAKDVSLQSHFRLTSYIDDRNREQATYDIDSDGFILLIMGFTGQKALQVKLLYINAFNKMEDAFQGVHDLVNGRTSFC